MVTFIARFQVDSLEPRQVTGLDADWFSLLTRDRPGGGRVSSPLIGDRAGLRVNTGQ